ncbi:unnamed protein product, partial [Amoebophrya sp. A25]
PVEANLALKVVESYGGIERVEQYLVATKHYHDLDFSAWWATCKSERQEQSRKTTSGGK